MQSKDIRMKLEKLTFSGKEDDFALFVEQFEARMCVLGLGLILANKVEFQMQMQTRRSMTKL